MERYNDNILQHLKWQQNEAPYITGILTKKAAWRENFHDDFWTRWAADIYDINTAKQFGLALWCIILGVSSDLFDFNPATQRWAFGQKRQNFVYNSKYGSSLPANKQSPGGNFGNSDTSLTNLDDIRTLLKFRYATLVSNGRVEYMNKMMNIILNDGAPWNVFNKEYAYAIDKTSIPVDLDAKVWIENWQGIRQIATGASSARKTYLFNSEDLFSYKQTLVHASVFGDSAYAPDGNLTADKLVADTALDKHKITLVTNDAYPAAAKYMTFSVFLRAGGYENLSINIEHSKANAANQQMTRNTYNIPTRTVGGGGQVKTAIFSNGWSRLTITVPIISGYTNSEITLTLMDNVQSETFAGDGDKGAFIWGYMVEANADQNADYVATTNAASSVIGANNVTSAGVVSFGRIPPKGTKILWSGSWGIGSYAKPVLIDTGDGAKNSFQITKPMNDGAAITKDNYIEFRIGKNVNLSDALILLMNARENGLMFQNAGVAYQVIKET